MTSARILKEREKDSNEITRLVNKKPKSPDFDSTAFWHIGNSIRVEISTIKTCIKKFKTNLDFVKTYSSELEIWKRIVEFIKDLENEFLEEEEGVK